MPRYDFALEGVDPHVAIEQLNRLTIMSSPRSSLAPHDKLSVILIPWGMAQLMRKEYLCIGRDYGLIDLINIL